MATFKKKEKEQIDSKLRQNDLFKLINEHFESMGLDVELESLKVRPKASVKFDPSLTVTKEECLKKPGHVWADVVSPSGKIEKQCIKIA